MSPILDPCSNDLISDAVSDRPGPSIVTSTLEKTFEKIPDRINLILHSGRGRQYQRKQYLQKFQSMEHFEQELIEYLDYYKNLRITARLKGLPSVIHRQQALSVA